MTSMTKCTSAVIGTDPNNNLSSSIKSYSLRPRGARKSEDQRSTEYKEPRLKCKRKPRSMPLSKYRRKTANARERSRMRGINEAFESLRRAIPEMAFRECNGEKLTKITTLRLAMKYISALSGLLQDQDFESDRESFLDDYTTSLTSSDSHDGLPSASSLEAPTTCSGAPMTFMDSFITSDQVFDGSSYLIDDVSLFMSEFS